MITSAARLGRNIGRHLTVRSSLSAAGSGRASVAERTIAIAPPLAEARHYRGGLPLPLPLSRDARRKIFVKWLSIGAGGALIGYYLFFYETPRIKVLEAQIKVLKEAKETISRLKKELEEKDEKNSSLFKKLEWQAGENSRNFKQLEKHDEKISKMLKELEEEYEKLRTLE